MKRWIYVASATLAGALLAPAHRAEAASAAPSAAFAPQAAPADLPPNDSAKALIDGVGIGCEPASAASLAGLKKLRTEGVILPEHTAVGLLTGNILKDTDALTSYHFEDVNGAPRAAANRPLRVAAELSALEQALADALHG